MMTKSILLASAAVATLLGTSALASAQSIDEALAAAYLNNPTLQAQRAQVRAADEGVPQALSGWRPTVSVSGEVGTTRYHRNYASVKTKETTVPYSVGVTVSQPLFRGFRTEAAVDSAEMTVLGQRAELRAVEQDVLLATATAYLNVVQYNAVVDLNHNNESVLQRQLQAAQDRFRVGEITRTDVAQAESRLSGAKADTATAQANLETALANFMRLVGTPAGVLNQPDAVPDLPAGREEAIQRALANNPSIIASEYAWKAAQENIRIYRGKLLPQVSLDGSFTQGWNQNYYDDYDLQIFTASVNVSIPIYQGGSVYSEVREAKHTAGQKRLNYDDTRTQIQEKTESAWEELKAAEISIQSLQDQIDAAKIALDGVQREAQVGARTVLDVLDAEQELLNAKVSMVKARRNRLVAAYTLLSAVGGLTADSLGLPVVQYDPVENYKDVRDQWFGSSASADEDASRGLGDSASGK